MLLLRIEDEARVHVHRYLMSDIVTHIAKVAIQVLLHT